MSKLYRYFSFKQHNIDSLVNKYLYFSNIEDFNDPFEDIYVSKENLPNPGDIDDSTLIRLHQKMKRRSPNAKVFSNDEFASMMLRGVSLIPFKNKLISIISESNDTQYEQMVTNKKHCCFIQDDKVTGKEALRNKLMWSHYADGMRGYCIEFEKEKLLDCLQVDKSNHISSGDMFYGNLSEISLLQCFEEYLDNPSVDLGKILQSKSSEWSYENEFRISSVKQKVIFDISCITSITIGFKMTLEQKNTLFTLLKGIGINDNIAVNEAFINKKAYDIDIVRCNSFYEFDILA